MVCGMQMADSAMRPGRKKQTVRVESSAAAAAAVAAAAVACLAAAVVAAAVVAAAADFSCVKVVSLPLSVLGD